LRSADTPGIANKNPPESPFTKGGIATASKLYAIMTNVPLKKTLSLNYSIVDHIIRHNYMNYVLGWQWPLYPATQSGHERLWYNT